MQLRDSLRTFISIHIITYVQVSSPESSRSISMMLHTEYDEINLLYVDKHTRDQDAERILGLMEMYETKRLCQDFKDMSREEVLKLARITERRKENLRILDTTIREQVVTESPDTSSLL
jgi:hypothetical protein